MFSIFYGYIGGSWVQLPVMAGFYSVGEGTVQTLSLTIPAGIDAPTRIRVDNIEVEVESVDENLDSIVVSGHYYDKTLPQVIVDPTTITTSGSLSSILTNIVSGNNLTIEGATSVLVNVATAQAGQIIGVVSSIAQIALCLKPLHYSTTNGDVLNFGTFFTRGVSASEISESTTIQQERYDSCVITQTAPVVEKKRAVLAQKKPTTNKIFSETDPPTLLQTREGGFDDWPTLPTSTVDFSTIVNTPFLQQCCPAFFQEDASTIEYTLPLGTIEDCEIDISDAQGTLHVGPFTATVYIDFELSNVQQYLSPLTDNSDFYADLRTTSQVTLSVPNWNSLSNATITSRDFSPYYQDLSVTITAGYNPTVSTTNFGANNWNHIIAGTVKPVRCYLGYSWNGLNVTYDDTKKVTFSGTIPTPSPENTPYWHIYLPYNESNDNFGPPALNPYFDAHATLVEPPNTFMGPYVADGYSTTITPAEDKCSWQDVPSFEPGQTIDELSLINAQYFANIIAIGMYGTQIIDLSGTSSTVAMPTASSPAQVTASAPNRDTHKHGTAGPHPYCLNTSILVSAADDAFVQKTLDFVNEGAEVTICSVPLSLFDSFSALRGFERGGIAPRSMKVNFGTNIVDFEFR